MNWKVTLTLLFVFTRAYGAGEHIEFYKGVRQMAMGGASVGVVNDQTALILNPAALGKLREAYLTLVDPVVDVSTNDATMAGDYSKYTTLLDMQKAYDARSDERRV